MREEIYEIYRLQPIDRWQKYLIRRISDWFNRRHWVCYLWLQAGLPCVGWVKATGDIPQLSDCVWRVQSERSWNRAQADEIGLQELGTADVDNNLLRTLAPRRRHAKAYIPSDSDALRLNWVKTKPQLSIPVVTSQVTNILIRICFQHKACFTAYLQNLPIYIYIYNILYIDMKWRVREKFSQDTCTVMYTWHLNEFRGPSVIYELMSGALAVG